LIGCNVHEVVYNPMFSDMTFLLTELLELVEGAESSSFDLRRIHFSTESAFDRE